MSDDALHSILRDTGLSPEVVRALVGVVQGVVRAEVKTLHARLGEDLLTKRQAAERAGVSEKTLQRRDAEGKVRRVPGPKRPMYHPREIDRAIREGVL